MVKGGPAQKAGLKKDEMVIGHQGKEIQDSAALCNEVTQIPIGQEAKLTVLRRGRKEEMTIKVGSLVDGMALLASAVKEPLGAEMRSPNPKEVEKYGLDANRGVVITHVDPKGALGKAGFEVDDMILAISDEPVEGMDSFIDLVSALPPGKRASFTALDHRTGNTGNIFVTAP